MAKYTITMVVEDNQSSREAPLVLEGRFRNLVPFVTDTLGLEIVSVDVKDKRGGLG